MAEIQMSLPAYLVGVAAANLVSDDAAANSAAVVVAAAVCVAAPRITRQWLFISSLSEFK